MLQSNERIVKHKIGLLNLAEERSNISRACKIMGTPSGVRSVWLRNQLACFKDRLRALEEKMAHEDLILAESQVKASGASVTGVSEDGEFTIIETSLESKKQDEPEPNKQNR